MLFKASCLFGSVLEAASSDQSSATQGITHGSPNGPDRQHGRGIPDNRGPLLSLSRFPQMFGHLSTIYLTLLPRHD